MCVVYRPEYSIVCDELKGDTTCAAAAVLKSGYSPLMQNGPSPYTSDGQESPPPW